MAQNFPLSFRNNTLRKHRQTILLEREKSMLPAMQVFVEAKKNMERLSVLTQGLFDTFFAARRQLAVLRAKSEEVKKHYIPLRERKEDNGQKLSSEEEALFDTYREQHRCAVSDANMYQQEVYMPAARAHSDNITEHQRWERIYRNGDDSPEGRVKREFLMKCPAEDCRGFLSTAYKCGVCEAFTCSDCLEVLGPSKEVAHTCNKDSVESAKAIKKETRPCPKCAARIFKIDGCDQMWCTVDGCNTAFSWNTGHVVTGRVHNPHYYEWLRRNGGGTAPREIGDIPCGGMPHAWHFTRAVIGTSFSIDQKNRILDIHRCVTDIEERLPQYPARPDPLMNKDLNVMYLMNRMTEADWQRHLEHTEAKFNRKKEIGQILQTLVTAAADTLQGIYSQLQGYKPGHKFILEQHVPQLEELRIYTNGALRTLAKSLHMAVPQIDAQWHWIPIRALYKEVRETVVPPLEGAQEAEANTVV